ncbi:DUF192 domain-containing protein [Mucisphaera sp.]|uniref:DUF192 domain-containing protein n=1 Tax=Mucisphaera sp. TaxID=2913024 RepID=UPI003D0A1CEC
MAVGCLAVVVVGCSPEPKTAEEIAEAIATAEIQAVEIDGRVFRLEIAADPDTRFQGLSDRAEIAPDGGMLFVFPSEARREFVMRRCLVPIDIIFLDGRGTVVQTHQMQVEPYDRNELALKRYGSRWPAQFAIEIAGGLLDELEVADGDVIELPLEALKAMAE